MKKYLITPTIVLLSLLFLSNNVFAQSRKVNTPDKNIQTSNSFWVPGNVTETTATAMDACISCFDKGEQLREQ